MLKKKKILSGSLSKFPTICSVVFCSAPISSEAEHTLLDRFLGFLKDLFFPPWRGLSFWYLSYLGRPQVPNVFKKTMVCSFPTRREGSFLRGEGEM